MAVKVYERDVTSDGSTADERALALAASFAPATAAADAGDVDLVHTLGAARYPNGTDALVLERLDGFAALGDPPSLATVTR